MGSTRRNIYHSGSHQFAVRGLSPEAIADLLSVSARETGPTGHTLSRYYDRLLDERWEGTGSDGLTPIAISAPVEGWVFLYWGYGDFDECYKIVERLLAAGATDANYYYSDMQVDSFDWIIGRNGAIVRALEYWGEITTNEGTPILERERQWVEELDEDGHRYSDELLLMQIFDATCPVSKQEFAADDVFITGYTPVPTLAERRKRYMESVLRFGEPYHAGPLAVMDWNKAGGFKGYLYNYELRLSKDGSYRLGFELLEKASLGEYPASQGPFTGKFAYTGPAGITLYFKGFEWHGVVVGRDSNYLAFEVVTPEGVVGNFCFQAKG